MKTLKQVYSSLYKKYQLKEVYNNLFEYREEKTLRHNLQGKSTNVVFFNETQEVSVPGVGTFQLNKFQTALVALVIEFYFGNKKVVKDILQYMLEIKIMNEEKLKDIKVIKFIRKCVKDNILNKDYNLVDEIDKKVLGDKTFLINQTFGFLFEIYLLKKIQNEGYENTNYNDFLDSAKNHLYCKYIFTILDIIYLKDENISNEQIADLFNENLTENRIDELGLKIDFGNINIIDNLVDDEIKKDKANLSFNFLYEGQQKERAIDIVVKYKEKVVSLLDLKTHESIPTINEIGEVSSRTYNNETSISRNKDSVKEQIANTINKETHPDFTIGILRTTHSFNKDSIEIIKSDCLYISYKEHNETIMSRKEKSYRIETKEEIGIVADGENEFKAIKENIGNHDFNLYSYNKINLIKKSKEKIHFIIFNKTGRNDLLKYYIKSERLGSAPEIPSRYEDYFEKNNIKQEEISDCKEEIRNYIFDVIKNEVIQEKVGKFRRNFNEVVNCISDVDNANYDQNKISYYFDDEIEEIINHAKKSFFKVIIKNPSNWNKVFSLINSKKPGGNKYHLYFVHKGFNNLDLEKAKQKIKAYIFEELRKEVNKFSKKKKDKEHYTSAREMYNKSVFYLGEFDNKDYSEYYLRIEKESDSDLEEVKVRLEELKNSIYNHLTKSSTSIEKLKLTFYNRIVRSLLPWNMYEYFLERNFISQEIKSNLKKNVRDYVFNVVKNEVIKIKNNLKKSKKIELYNYIVYCFEEADKILNSEVDYSEHKIVIYLDELTVKIINSLKLTTDTVNYYLRLYDDLKDTNRLEKIKNEIFEYKSKINVSDSNQLKNYNRVINKIANDKEKLEYMIK
tara:strand:+ start:549 stop:3095 length:2547 start_codon:yes stop_codon:yes gene_type:complete